MHVTSTLHSCWGAQAGLYYHYGIPKYQRAKKLSGIYRHRLLARGVPLVRGFDDYFNAPHSRYTEVRREDILKHPELEILAESDEAGIFLVVSRDGRQVFIQGHPEYDRMTLNLSLIHIFVRIERRILREVRRWREAESARIPTGQCEADGVSSCF